ncbi:hypothetical protein [Actinoplanes sp. NPDC026619]|uniref:hypothetical protein n=1 Tax=Actinoplanes sp. NPDC026619 TaxID=3155798 RepID=UPI0033F956AE
MDRDELCTALAHVLDQVKPERYRLVGTGAALAQGVRLPTGDIDILVERRSDVDRFAAVLGGTDPVWMSEPRQYFTHTYVGEIEAGMSTVEVPTESDGFECIGRGPWEHYVNVQVGEHVVPAVALELRLASELVRDRPDRYSALIGHLRSHGADLDLAARAMRDRGLSAELRKRVIDELARGGEDTPGHF